ncbi:MAG: 4Fe-4S dicluster domain-containing protein [Deltaproteobacteria bacterium]|jgi:Fe-S-cluster-containing dehydrogenase component|nr:4Fe-4S dicluster domain-containing protein [Deltaproteobacteria bacterium]
MPKNYERREFLADLVKFPCATLLLGVSGPIKALASAGDEYQASEHHYAMGVQIEKCIGCGKCVEACKIENDVPMEPYYFRTWIERYIIYADGEVSVDSPNGGIDGFPPIESEKAILRTFFVPKLCNHCENPPCVQVCPVGATFKTQDGVILVDDDYCIGCRYCIQACPYGARFLDPRTHTAGKCTFCYHRITDGLLPACVEICPTQARIFGELDKLSTPLNRMMRQSNIQVLKAHMNTEPKVFYSDLDGEVR